MYYNIDTFGNLKHGDCLIMRACYGFSSIYYELLTYAMYGTIHTSSMSLRWGAGLSRAVSTNLCQRAMEVVSVHQLVIDLQRYRCNKVPRMRYKLIKAR